MKKILIIILMLIMVTGVSSYESYNSYIEKELTQHNEFFDNFNLDELKFNENFITIISKESLSTFDKNLILQEAYKDSQSEFEALTNRVFENYKTQDSDIAKIKNQLQNKIIQLQNQQNNISILKSRNAEYKKLFNQLDELYEIAYDDLYECDECYESKDRLQFLEVDFTLISDKYAETYSNYLSDYEESIEEEIEECEDEEDKYDMYCQIKKSSEEFIDLGKEVNNVKNLNREELEEYQIISQEISKIKSLEAQIGEIHASYKSDLNKIRLNEKVTELADIEQFIENDESIVREYSQELSRFLNLLNTQINVKAKDPIIQLNNTYKNSIIRTIDQIEKSNEYKLKKLILINAILNSYNFYETNSELEKIYYEITNQILVKYYKQEENPRILKLNLVSDLQSLNLNYDKLKTYIDTKQDIQLSSQKNYDIIISEYQNILNGLLAELEKESTYDLKYFEGENPDEIEFSYQNEKIEQILKLISQELVKLKANEKLIVEENHDLTIYRINNQFFKDILIWLEIYRPADRVAEIEKKNEAFLILDKEERFKQSDLFNLNQKEVIQISSQKLELINRIQNEISYFLSKDSTYNLYEIQDFLNILDYYVFSKYIIEDNKDPFWKKISIDNNYATNLNKLTYQKIDKLLSKNQQNYLKNNYNDLIKNRLNPNIYFIKIISEDNEEIELNSTKLGEQDFELLKYAFMSISQDYENLKLNKNNLYEDIANYDLNIVEEAQGLFEKLSGSHNLDFSREYKIEINNVVAEDIVFLLRDRMNLKLINLILEAREPVETKNLESYIEKVAKLKKQEIQHILSSYFDSYTSDTFNQKYLQLLQSKQVDPLINYLNNFERRYIFFDLNKNGKQELNYNIKYDYSNSDLINSLLSNKRNGYIYSQDREKEILEKEINNSIAKVLSTNNRIHELIKLDLLFQAYNYYFTNKYENLRIENQQAILSSLTGNSNTEQIKSAAKIESIVNPETKLSFASSTNKLMALLDLLDGEQINYNQTAALEIITEMNKWVVSQIIQKEIQLEKINDPDYLYELDENTSVFDNKLGIKTGNDDVVLVEVHKKLVQAIDTTVESDNYDHLFNIVELSTVFDSNVNYKVLDRSIERIKNNKILNLNEIKRHAFLTEECQEFIPQTAKVSNENLYQMLNTIFECKKPEFNLENYDKDLVYSKLFEVQKNNLKVRQFQGSSPVAFIPVMIESINSTLFLNSFVSNFKPKEMSFMEEFSVWFGAQREEFEVINTSNVEQLQALNKDILSGGLLEKNFDQVQDRILFEALLNDYLKTSEELFESFALSEPEPNRIFVFNQEQHETVKIEELYDDFVFKNKFGVEYDPNKLNNNLKEFVDNEIYFVEAAN